MGDIVARDGLNASRRDSLTWEPQRSRMNFKASSAGRGLLKR